MNYKELKNTLMSNKFINTYIVIFVVLFIFVSFIKFLGSLPILIVITGLITYFIIHHRVGDKFELLKDLANSI
tara:strand:+ start:179 stop:397 length:219 start_codon:yes stop_codon:yes gene_type:complete